ncbi:MAG: hypothetical protein K9N49_03760 [Candidatus Marinimicrobia bacterium]|nr:hypothetical protein [Candidatus Neomarinimicrobiota bacterium]
MRTATMMKMIQRMLCLALVWAPLVASADWTEGDPYKMHYPQLPNPNGWDVKVDGPNVVADDFQCTQNGPITSIHFWGSWKGDTVGLLSNIHLSLHADIPANPGDPDSYSMPGDELWTYNTYLYDPGLVTIRLYGTGDQGWYDPITPAGVGQYLENDHQDIWQYNVMIDPSRWFEQQSGTIYWLDIHVANETENTEFGWKTSSNHWNDDAVTEDFYETLPVDWIELRDPITAESLDMAFVIVPEPHAALLALLGGVACWLAGRRKSRSSHFPIQNPENMRSSSSA